MAKSVADFVFSYYLLTLLCLYTTLYITMSTKFVSRVLVSSIALSAILACVSQSTVSCSGNVESPFMTDSVVFERNWSLPQPKENDPLGGRSRFSAKIDYPKAHQQDSVLADSVRAWISVELLPKGEKILANRSVLDKAANIFFGECEGNEWGEEMDISVRKIFEDADYVTFEADKYTYTGGQHGSYAVSGATFERATGRRLTWQNIKKSDELRQLITAGIRKDKGEPSDSAFKTMLLIDEHEYKASDGSIMLPLPKANPWLSQRGWVFTYQPYEILPWSQGAPACRLSTNQVSMN